LSPNAAVVVAFACSRRSRRCHAFLATVLRLVPKAKAELFPVLSACAPFRSRDVSEIVHYYRSCLIVLQYHPGLQTSVLDLLVDKCLEMDVEIKISDLGEASIDSTENDKGGADTAGCFELELDGPKPSPAKAESPTVDEMATRLDALMMLLFEYMAQSDAPLTMLYDILFRVFESSILICYKSKFVQYLLFYLCGLHEGSLGAASRDRGRTKADHDASVVLHRDFLSKLINIVLDPFRATATRQSGACYVASFVSRARFVAPDTVCEAVSALLRWSEAYLQSLDASDSGGLGVPTPLGQMSLEDVHEQCNLHSLFYTVCQSAFYIMCFRGVEALSYFNESTGSAAQDDEFFLQHVDISTERWSRICGHHTQPLRFCLESVRVEFLALAGSHALLDTNVMQRLQLQQELSMIPGRTRKVASVIQTAATLEKERLSGGVGGLGRGQNPLDSFFPFDPYLLSTSYSYVEPLYIHWCGVAGESGVSRSMSPSVALDDAAEADAQSDDDDVSQAQGSVASASAERDENGSKTGSEDEESDDDEENGSRAGSRDRQPMSFVSTSSALPVGSGTPVTATTKREELRAAWTDTLKRSRAASVENGSW
jgi:RNA polymerase I-specific transcription initiation factor RRN3